MPEQRQRFPPLCPDLVVSWPSPSDEGSAGWSALRRKMARPIKPTAPRLGWLFAPDERAVEIGPPAATPTPGTGHGLSKQGLSFPGLRLDLEEIWQPAANPQVNPVLRLSDDQLTC